MNNPYEFNTFASAVDVDCRDVLKPSGLMRFMQEAGNAHLKDMGGGYEALKRAGLAFILTRAVMTLPQVGYFEPVVLRTWHQGNRGPYFVRNFEFHIGGLLGGRATTLWVLMDVAAKRILRPSSLPIEISSLPERESGLDTPRIEFPAELQKTGQRPVFYGDIDHYHHMNNTVYADICCDFLPGGMDGRRVSRLDISFLSETAEGDVLDIFAAEQGDTAYVRGVIRRGRGVIRHGRGTRKGGGAGEDVKSFEARLGFEPFPLSP